MRQEVCPCGCYPRGMPATREWDVSDVSYGLSINLSINPSIIIIIIIISCY